MELKGNRTDRSGTVRWTVPATSADTGGYHNFRPWRAKMQIDSRTQQTRRTPARVSFFLELKRNRTDRSGTVRWTVPATSADTGGYHNFRPWRAKMQIDSRTQQTRRTPARVSFFLEMKRNRTDRTGGYHNFRPWRAKMQIDFRTLYLKRTPY